MIRKIVKIDEEKCNGCGLCANACREGAIAMVNGKAKLIREDYCDGLGNCLPVCPVDAIAFEKREAPAFDGRAAAHTAGPVKQAVFHGCPGSMAKALKRRLAGLPETEPAGAANETGGDGSELMQWPVQIKLAPVNAPYFEGADLLIAADCTAYAYAGFHRKFMKNRITLIGCPKLDEGDYAEKLTEILKRNNIRSVKVVRMEVPCCCGIEHAVRRALTDSGKMIPWQVVVLSTDGRILEE